MVKNDYYIFDDCVYIVLNSKGNKFVLPIDKEDLPLLSGSTIGMSGNYPAFRKNGKICYIHRVIAKPQHGLIVDHIDGDKLDSRKSNLRVCTHKENNRNPNNKYKTGVSGFRNVHYIKSTGKYAVKITIDNKTYNFGCFDCKYEANEFAIKKRKEVYGDEVF